MSLSLFSTMMHRERERERKEKQQKKFLSETENEIHHNQVKLIFFSFPLSQYWKFQLENVMNCIKKKQFGFIAVISGWTTDKSEVKARMQICWSWVCNTFHSLVFQLNVCLTQKWRRRRRKAKRGSSVRKVYLIWEMVSNKRYTLLSTSIFVHSSRTGKVKKEKKKKFALT